MSEWKDTSFNKRIYLKIQLPSGAEVHDFKMRVEEGGHQIVVQHKLSKDLICPSLQLKALRHNAKNQYTRSDIRINAFAEAIMDLQNFSSRDEIWTTMRIEMPFQVEEQFYNDGSVPPVDFFLINNTRFLGLELIGVRNNFQSSYIKFNSFRCVTESNQRDSTSFGQTNKYNDKEPFMSNQGDRKNDPSMFSQGRTNPPPKHRSNLAKNQRRKLNRSEGSNVCMPNQNFASKIAPTENTFPVQGISTHTSRNSFNHGVETKKQSIQQRILKQWFF